MPRSTCRAGEPLRIFRRPFGLGHGAKARTSARAKERASASAGGRFPMGSSKRRVLNQSAHSRVANPTASKDRHGPHRWITSVSNRPLIVSARALSSLSPSFDRLRMRAADRGRDPRLRQPLRVAQGEVLRAPVAMVHEPAALAGTTFVQGLLRSPHPELVEGRAQRWRAPCGRPASRRCAGLGVDHERVRCRSRPRSRRR